MNILMYYLLFINMIAFLAYGSDKRRAQKKQWRISEKTLLLLAAAGGSAGAWAGMLIFHHKTKHLKFRIGVPAIFLIQLLIGIFVRLPI